MVKNALFCLALFSAGVVGASLEAGVNDAAAADDCITESNLVPPKGSRWSYHMDRATNRKCWFLMKVTPAAAQTPLLTVARVPPERRKPSISGQNGQRSTRKLSESEQAAMFPEFLRWKEQHNAVNSSAVESLQGAISP
jgi:hypothetical protein